MLARFKWAILFFALFLLIIPIQIVLVVQESQRSQGFTLQSPGELPVTLEQGGDYTLWLQNQATQGPGVTSFFSMTPPAGMTITLQRESDQSTVPIHLGGMNKTVTLGNMQRQSIATVQIPAPGEYRLIVGGSDEPRLVYFSRDFLGRVILMSLCFGCTTALLFFASAALAIRAMVANPQPAAPAIEQPL